MTVLSYYEHVLLVKFS